MSTDAQWDMAVTKFSGRALTVESDKLIAFAAAAEYFEALFSARWPHIRYAAGLWFSRENPFLRKAIAMVVSKSCNSKEAWIFSSTELVLGEC